MWFFINKKFRLMETGFHTSSEKTTNFVKELQCNLRVTYHRWNAGFETISQQVWVKSQIICVNRGCYYRHYSCLKKEQKASLLIWSDIVPIRNCVTQLFTLTVPLAQSPTWIINWQKLRIFYCELNFIISPSVFKIKTLICFGSITLFKYHHILWYCK
jgi:hypothetical protein